jgi:hypothetical protein
MREYIPALFSVVLLVHGGVIHAVFGAYVKGRQAPHPPPRWVALTLLVVLVAVATTYVALLAWAGPAIASRLQAGGGR